jgi:DNA-binding response OmpR family regulator
MAKVLIIEDDAVLAEMYEAKFKHEGHEVKTVLSGEQALKALNDYQPELILLDILMPKLNGFHVLKEIKKNQAARYTPIILLTNLEQSELAMDEEMARAIGVSDYLVKGQHTPDEVVARVIKHLKPKK